MIVPQPDDPHGPFRILDDERAVAVAVSGGGDSMALLVLCARWAAETGKPVLALTVDHRLRPESGEEAATVARFCAERGIPHRILTWDDHDGIGNLSARAREARYGLMLDICRDEGIPVLLTGHTRDDQAETVLMRLSRGSGVDGLAAIPVQARRGEIRILRPLLDHSREDLREVLQAEGVDWSDDPTNEDTRYDRVQARQALDTLAPIGLTPERLARTARMMGRAKAVLEDAADALDAAACERFALGYALIDPVTLHHAREETGLRLLARLLCEVSGQVYRPRLDALERLHTACTNVGFVGATLHGCAVHPHDGRLAICREPQACDHGIALEADTLWDRRFVIDASVLPSRAGLSVTATGEDGLTVLKAADAPLPEHWTVAPRAARLCTPALRHGPDIVSIPLAGWSRATEAAECRVSVTSLTQGAVVDPDREAFI